MARKEQIQLRLQQIEDMRRKKIPWKKIAILLHERGLGPPSGGVWTIDSLLSFYHSQRGRAC